LPLKRRGARGEREELFLETKEKKSVVGLFLMNHKTFSLNYVINITITLIVFITPAPGEEKKANRTQKKSLEAP
jgi:hypothetical protein